MKYTQLLIAVISNWVYFIILHNSTSTSGFLRMCCSVFDDVERRVRAVRRDAGVDAAVDDRVVRVVVQHALRVAERADTVVDAPQRQRRVHALPPTVLPPRHHTARPRLPLDQDLLRLRRQRRYEPPTC